MNADLFENMNYYDNDTFKNSTKTFPITNKRMIKLIDPFIHEICDGNYKLRRRKDVNYKATYDFSSSEESNEQGDINLKKYKRGKKGNQNSDDEIFHLKKKIRVLKKKDLQISKKIKNQKIFKTYNCKTLTNEYEFNSDEHLNDNESLNETNEKFSQVFNEEEFVEFKKYINLEDLKKETSQEIMESKMMIKKLEIDFFKNEFKISNNKSKYSDNCIPICADIRSFNFNVLINKQRELTNGKLFDVIMMDPPWQLSSSQPTRGVAIAYDTLSDNIITEIPIENLLNDGFLFIWTINAKFKTSLDLLKKWGYSYHDEIVWVKQTVNGKIAKGHGYYLQHTKETCLIGKKGNPLYNKDVYCDVIFSKRRGQSQKPEEIYKFIEALIPNGFYLEIFGRRNNLRQNWITLGNEL